MPFSIVKCLNLGDVKIQLKSTKVKENSHFFNGLYPKKKKNLPRGSILPDPRKEARLNRATTLENAGYVTPLIASCVSLIT